VTSKAQRRNRKRSNKSSRVAPLTDDDVDELSRPLRLIIEGSDRLHGYLGASSGDPAAAAMTARNEAIAIVQEVAAVAMPFDAFDVLENVRLSQVMTNPATYQETEHEGSAAVIELTALALAARGHRAGNEVGANGHRPRADAAVQQILDEMGHAVDVGVMSSSLDALADIGDSTAIQLGALLRELNVRNLSFTHMLEDTLTELFDEPSIETDCRTAMGCSVHEIREVFTAILSLHDEAWRNRFTAIRDFVLLTRNEMEKAKESPADYSPSSEVRTQSEALWDAAWNDPADASTFSDAAIATRAGVDASVVQQVIDVFAYDMVVRDPGLAAEEFFDGHAPFRTRPILRDPDGSWVPVHAGLLLPAVRERVEQRLKDANRWERYAKHRGDYLEEAALGLLTPNFPTATIHHGFEYFVPNPDSNVPEVIPAHFTKLVEGDGLLVVDDVALVVEAKAGALSDLSRAGDARRLARDLRKIVTDAAAQADRLRDRIRADGGLRLRNNSWLDMSYIREIHTIAVSLEDLSGIATLTSDLVRGGVLVGAELPWTVSLHDLRIISELIERPAELLLYLRRRTEPDVTRCFHAIDELDFFLEFYANGLYVEPDPDRVFAELPQLGEPNVATKRRFKRQPLTMLTSRTDRLDAWYFYKLGIRQAPAPKPRFNANPELCVLVDALANRRHPGWLRTGTSLLDLSGPVQRNSARYAGQVANLTNQDGQRHSVTAAGGTRADNSFVLAWVTIARGEPQASAEENLGRYVTAKKHQLQFAIGAGFLFDPAHPEVPCFVAYDNRRPGADTKLDATMASFNLRPVERSTVRVPKVGQRGRVTQSKRRSR